MGSRTQISGLLGAGAIAVVLLFLTAPMQYLPKATLGAVIVFAAIGLVDIPAWRGLARTSRVEVAIAATTMAGVVLVGVLQALIIAVALSIIDVARRSATPHDAVLGWVERLGRYADVRLHPSARITPGCWCTGWTTGGPFSRRGKPGWSRVVLVGPLPQRTGRLT